MIDHTRMKCRIQRLLLIATVLVPLGSLCPAVRGQYTAPAVDTAKKAVHHYAIRDPKIIFSESPNPDNSQIDLPTQFPGERSLTTSALNANEKHLRNIRQLTFSGENADPHLSPDGTHITFQARSSKTGACDQIFTMTLDGKNLRRVSSGKGKTISSFYLPPGDKILFSSTETAYAGYCPPEPDKSKGYVWPLYPSYDIYVTDTSGTLLGRLTDNTSDYDAEASVSPKGDRIVFTSTRSGDIDLYSMNLDGSDVKQLTTNEGYDGDASYSPDGSQIVFCASRPTGDGLKEYRELRKQSLLKPHDLALYTMNADGSNQHQITHEDGSCFSPSYFPDGKRIIFSSSMNDPKGRAFQLYTINTDGTGLERISDSGGFDGFPQFTADGKHLVFCSSRNSKQPNGTNIFIADWVE